MLHRIITSTTSSTTTGTPLQGRNCRPCREAPPFLILLVLLLLRCSVTPETTATATATETKPTEGGQNLRRKNDEHNNNEEEKQQQEEVATASSSSSLVLAAEGGRITNGYNAMVGEFPWFVSLVDGECGGSLLSPTRVLAAAHCFLDVIDNIGGGTTVGNIPYVRVGHTTLDTTKFDGEIVNVECVSIHPNFAIGALGTQAFFNDIAIIKLSEPGVSNTTTTTFATLNQDPKYPSIDGVGLTAIGLGGQKTLEAWLPGWEPPETLQKVGLSFLPLQDCQHTWPCVNSNNHMCANREGERKGVCQGDSGGPLLDKDGVLVGHATFLGVICGSETPDVFVPVANYYDWIQEELTSDTCTTEFPVSPFCAETPKCQTNSWWRLFKNIVVGGWREFKISVGWKKEDY